MKTGWQPWKSDWKPWMSTWNGRPLRPNASVLMASGIRRRPHGRPCGRSSP
ncbi:hypothetical protein ACFFX0_01400 [Citricoccus parietis]|uniref:Uncharacterized protein n=1 Tax=Citricoccus parietis TaxID=592307 RepID=A0ABV5FTA8_9MICC